MKINISLFALFALTLSLCSCGGGSSWEATQRPDEFGDISESSPTMISTTVEGEYSNLETSNGELVVHVNFLKNTDDPIYCMEFELLEDGTKNALYETSFDMCQLKTKAGETVSEFMLDALALDDSANKNLYLSSTSVSTDHFYEANVLFGSLYEGTDLQCIIYNSATDSQYHFTLPSEGFAKVCDATGFSPACYFSFDQHCNAQKEKDLEFASAMTLAEALEVVLSEDLAQLEIANECIIQNMSNYEILNGADIEDALNGYYMAITGPIRNGYKFEDVDDCTYFIPYWYSPVESWYLYQYDPSTQTKTILSVIETDSTGRIFTGEHGGGWELSFQEETFSASLSPTYFSQLIKITDDIYIKDTRCEGTSFREIAIVFKCPEAFTTDIADGTSVDKLMDYISTELLPEIE